MPKVKYDGAILDSQLEVDYYKHLKQQGTHFVYHHKHPIELDFMEKGYTIDFLEFYPVHPPSFDLYDVVLTETKGYNQFSHRVDNMIHSAMKNKIKDQEYFRGWLKKNGINPENVREIKYQKIKKNSKLGFVDWSYKAPTRYSILKPKYDTLVKEHKAVKNQLKALEKLRTRDLKDIRKYFEYQDKDKLTSAQINAMNNLKDKFLL